MSENKIEFIATLPDMISAINIGGADHNSRIKLDIPETEIAAVVNLLALPKNKPFKITIEEIPGGDW